MRRVNNIYDSILDIKVIQKIYSSRVMVNTKNKLKLEKFENNYVSNMIYIKQILEERNYKPGRYNIFLIKEPKYRIIMSQGIYDKVINHYIAKYVLDKKLSKYLDIRNVATRRNMGSSYGIKLIFRYIEKLKRKNSEFYILKLDISKYFYSIDHNVLKELIKDKLTKEEYYFLEKIIDSTDEDYVNNTISNLKNKEL